MAERRPMRPRRRSWIGNPLRPLVLPTSTLPWGGLGTPSHRVRDFQRWGTRFAKSQHRTWGRAAKVLGCDERTLRDDAGEMMRASSPTASGPCPKVCGFHHLSRGRSAGVVAEAVRCQPVAHSEVHRPRRVFQTALSRSESPRWQTAGCRSRWPSNGHSYAEAKSLQREPSVRLVFVDIEEKQVAALARKKPTFSQPFSWWRSVSPERA
jgi:hypothetical protein